MPRNNSSKGSTFERDICRKLSLWFSEGQRDDIFWRTAGSGARGTVRGKAGKTTYGAYGDIQAVDPAGEPLMRCFTFELKKGYPRATITDAIDTIQQGKKLPEFVQFVLQAKRSQALAKSHSWAVIHKRDNKHTTITMPYCQPWADILKDCRYRTIIYLKFKLHGHEPEKLNVMQCRLEDFLRLCSPSMIKELAAQ